MKKRILAAAVVIILVLVVITGFLLFRRNSSISAVIYYLDKSQTQLVAENESISFTEPKTIPENIIGKLRKKTWGRKSPIAENCTLNSVSFDNTDSITVDFSKEFLSPQPQLNVLRTYAVVKSICSTSQFLGIQRARITVEGKPVTAPDGHALSYIDDASINIMDSEEIMTYECELYFTNKRTGALKSERRTIDAANGTVEFNAVSALIDGPVSKELSRIFPRGTALISAETWDGVCYVNFSKLPDNARMDVITAAMKYTLSAFNGVESVKLLINGKDIK